MRLSTGRSTPAAVRPVRRLTGQRGPLPADHLAAAVLSYPDHRVAPGGLMNAGSPMLHGFEVELDLPGVHGVDVLGALL